MGPRVLARWILRKPTDWPDRVTLTDAAGGQGGRGGLAGLTAQRWAARARAPLLPMPLQLRSRLRKLDSRPRRGARTRHPASPRRLPARDSDVSDGSGGGGASANMSPPSAPSPPAAAPPLVLPPEPSGGCRSSFAPSAAIVLLLRSSACTTAACLSAACGGPVPPSGWRLLRAYYQHCGHHGALTGNTRSPTHCYAAATRLQHDCCMRSTCLAYAYLRLTRHKQGCCYSDTVPVDQAAQPGVGPAGWAGP